jgi:hypothetical protein
MQPFPISALYPINELSNAFFSVAFDVTARLNGFDSGKDLAANEADFYCG